jgi:hypothetical protein
MTMLTPTENRPFDIWEGDDVTDLSFFFLTFLSTSFDKKYDKIFVAFCAVDHCIQ